MANKQARYSIGVTTAEYDDANCIRDDIELKDYKGEKMCRRSLEIDTSFQLCSEHGIRAEYLKIN